MISCKLPGHVSMPRMAGVRGRGALECQRVGVVCGPGLVSRGTLGMADGVACQPNLESFLEMRIGAK